MCALSVPVSGLPASSVGTWFQRCARATITAATSLALLAGLAAATPASAQDWGTKMLEKPSHDFGVIATGSQTSTQLKLKNIYALPVNLLEVKTSCGCMKADLSPRVIQPGAEETIDIKVDTERFKGDRKVNLKVSMSMNGYGTSTAFVPLHAYIRSDVVMTPGEAAFGTVDSGTEANRVIKISYAGRPNWTIKEVQVNNPNITAEARETSRNGGYVQYDLVVRVKPNAPIGVVRDQVTIVTDDATSPNVPLLVEAKVESEFVVTPDPVYFGSLTTGQQKAAMVIVRGKRPFKIEKIECEGDHGAFKCKLPEETKTLHQIPLTVTVIDGLPSLDELFTITIAGRAEPLQFRTGGKILPTADPAPALSPENTVSKTPTPGAGGSN